MAAITTLRGALATALTNAGVWSVFSFPPATLLANSVVVTPSDPYIVPSNNDHITVLPLANFRILMAVPAFDNQGNLKGITPSIDISDVVSSAVINQIVDELEITAFGDTSHRYVAGLQSGTFTIDFMNDWASSEVSQTLNDAFGKTLSVSVITVKGTAVSAANPTYQFSILVNNLTPIGSAGVAEIATSSITFTVNSAITVSPSVAF
jgi:hypothetical protein